MNRVTILVAALALASFGCDSSSEGTAGAGGSGGSSGTGGSGGDGNAQAVTIQFAAMVGEEDFVCGDTYENLGANDTSLQLSDFRFYVQSVALQNADEEWIPVELTENMFQIDGVALLDFEDGCGEVGNPDLNAEIVGTVPQGEYAGVRFTMGVPVELNHADASTAPGPLGLTSMFWNWRGGYKFLRIDSGTFSMTDWRMHLGSTACGMGDPTAPPDQPCANENRVEAELDAFDVESDTVVADFAALVDGAPLNVNADMTPVGCMSGLDDPDCGPIFENLGLAFGDQPAGTQIFFSVE